MSYRIERHVGGKLRDVLMEGIKSRSKAYGISRDMAVVYGNSNAKFVVVEYRSN